MSEETERHITRLLETRPDVVDTDGAFAEQVIADAERALAVRFPPSYRDFLSRYGVLGLGGKEIYGLTRADRDQGVGHAGAPSTVGFTLSSRRNMELPQTLVVVLNDDGVELLCIDTGTHDAAGESPVVMWNVPTRGDVQVRVAGSFDEYLLRLVREFEENVAEV